MRRKKIVVLPWLHDANGDMTKPWFIEYSYRNYKTDILHRFRISKGLNQLKTAKLRYALANQIIKEYTDKINHGWTPFDREEVH